MARAPPVSGRLRLTPTTELAEALDAAAGRNQVERLTIEHEVFAVEVTSTTGDAPVTVIVSSRAPTPSSALSVAVNSAGRMTPSRGTS
jgi:hypothetical protein